MKRITNGKQLNHVLRDFSVCCAVQFTEFTLDDFFFSTSL